MAEIGGYVLDLDLWLYAGYISSISTNLYYFSAINPLTLHDRYIHLGAELLNSP